MSNRLEYSLGLATSNFLGPIVGANQALELFGKAISGIGAVAGRVFSQIERGGSLWDLSNRTGESVENLFKLQFAFEQSGVAAGNVGNTLLRFQKSLSGVGEMGENTAEAFAALGLSVEELRGISAPEALLKVFEALNKLPRESATGVASTLFGRGAAGDVLQLARDSKDVGENLKYSAEQAKLFQANAKAFDAFGDALGRIKLQVDGIFANLAAEITPALNAIGPAIEQNKLGDLLEAELTVGFAEAINFFSRGLQRVFASLPHLWVAAVNGMAAATTGLVGGLVKATGGSALTLAAPALPFGMGTGLAELEKRTGGVSKFLGGLAGHFGGAFAGGINSAIGAAVNANVVDLLDTGEAKAKRDSLRKKLKGPDGEEKPKAPAVSDILSAIGGSAFSPLLKMDVNELQRSGLWNSPGANTDSSAIRAGVVQMVQHLAEIRRAVTNPSTPQMNFLNA
jgi:hypothetical protein